ncbi:MAG: glycosyltransferase family 39 protein [Nanoarchaeota archaeon]
MSHKEGLEKKEGHEEKKGALDRALKTAKTHWGIITILIVFIAWRLYFMTRNHDVIWDEAVYLGIGKFLWSAGGAGLWEIIRPIGLPSLIGLPWKLGLDQIFWAEIIAIAFSSGCVFLTYRLGAKMHSKTAGAIAAMILATAPTFFLYSGYVLTDIPSTFFLLLALNLFYDKKIAWSGLAAGLAFMTRFPHGLALAALGGTLGIYYLLDRKSSERFDRMWKFLAAFSILPALYMIANWFLYHNETSKTWHALFRPWILASWHAGNPSEGAESALFYFKGILGEDFLMWLAALGLIWFLLKKEYEEQEKAAPWIVLIVYLLYFSSILNKQMRFAMPMLPLLSIFGAVGLVETIEWIGYTPERKRQLRAFALAAVIACLALFLYPEDQKYYGWRFEQPQPIVREVYKYFDSNDVKGVVLTADPLVAAYSSGYFEPFYFSVDSTAAIYDQTIGSAWGVLYVPEAFWCGADDKTCKDGLTALESKIKRDNELVLEKKYGREDTGFRTYQIWKKKKTQ